MIVIVDYDMGNIRSLSSKIEGLGFMPRVSAAPADILAAERIILPGVGRFAAGMASIRAKGLVEPLRQAALDKGTPFFGVCLGMHLLAEKGAERDDSDASEGLGLLPADVVRFDFPGLDKPPKVPHVGWSRLQRLQPCPILDAAPPTTRFYFTHPYHMVCREPAHVVATARYGYDFAAVVQSGNIFGAQFHPEKSHLIGMALFQAFLQGATD